MLMFSCYNFSSSNCLLCGVTLQFKNLMYISYPVMMSYSMTFGIYEHVECIQFYVCFIIINKTSIFLQIETYKLS